VALVQFGGNEKGPLESNGVVSLDRDGDPMEEMHLFTVCLLKRSSVCQYYYYCMMKTAPAVHKRTCVNRSGVTESRDVDSHVSRTPQSGSRGLVNLLTLHTVAPPLRGLLAADQSAPN